MDDAAGTRVAATPRARVCIGARRHARMPARLVGSRHGSPLNRCDVGEPRGNREGTERVEAGGPRVYSEGV